MNRFSASLLVSLLLNGCNHGTPSAYSLPVTHGPSGASQENFDSPPTVRLPARVAMARIEAGHAGYRMMPVIPRGGSPAFALASPGAGSAWFTCSHDHTPVFRRAPGGRCP